MFLKSMKVDAKKVVHKLFPVTRWIRQYDGETAMSDMVAGVTVALTLIPQAIAYASLAELDPQYGLYASFAGSLIYVVLGTCPQINIGPTALLSLLTLSYTRGTNPDFAVLLCFLSGCVQLLAGMGQLGFLVEFVSEPVVSGFTSAAALIIACSQMKGLLGLTYRAETFIDAWRELFRHVKYTRLADTLLSITCIIVIVTMKQLKDLTSGKSSSDSNKSDRRQRVLQRACWLASVGRNAAVVVFCAVVAYLMDINNSSAFILTGEIVPGLPTVSLPPFTTSIGNTTFTFTDMVTHLQSGLIVVPLIGIIANVAIAKAFANGKQVEATQEIIALGICNIVGAFFQSYPTNGSFTRSAVSNTSGVRTPAAGLYTGVIVLLTLTLLTPYFFFIPKAALSSVIVCAVLHMIDFAIVRDLWHKSRLDLIPLCGTFLACLLLSVEMGLLVGVAIDLLILLYFNARPDFKVEAITKDISSSYYLVRTSGCLLFPAAGRVREAVAAAGRGEEGEGGTASAGGDIIAARPVVFDCASITRTDWSTVKSIRSLVADFKALSRPLIFLNLQEPLYQKLKKEIGADLVTCTTGGDLESLLTDTPTICVTAVPTTGSLKDRGSSIRGSLASCGSLDRSSYADRGVLAERGSLERGSLADHTSLSQLSLHRIPEESRQPSPQPERQDSISGNNTKL